MKKKKLNQLALLGVTSGLMAICPSKGTAREALNAKDPSPASLQECYKPNYLLAAYECNGPNGCPGTKSKKPSSKSSASDEIAAKEPDQGNLGYHLYTEDELLLELNEKGTALYNSLDAEGKALARLVASQRCDHTNACKGLNACQTDKNKCAGKGSCKGESKCAFSDKNLAVQVVADKMAKKRAEANKSLQTK